MGLSVGRILGIGTGYNAGEQRRIEAFNGGNFIQASVTSGQKYNLNYPAQADSTPYGNSPRAKHLDVLA